MGGSENIGDNIAQVFFPGKLITQFGATNILGWLVTGGAGVGTIGFLAVFFATGTAWVALVLGVIILAIMFFLPSLAVLVLALLFYVRTWMLLFLITISPLAFLGISWGPTQTLFKRWWNQFLMWTFMVPIAFFFFWIAVELHQAVHKSCLSTPDDCQFGLGLYIAGLVLVWLAVMAPFKLGGAVGSVVGGAIKRYGGAAAGWGAAVGYGKLSREMESIYRRREREDKRRLPSPRAFLAGYKRSRERETELSMVPVAASVQEYIDTYITKAKLRSPFSKEFWRKGLLKKGFSIAREEQRAAWLKEGINYQVENEREIDEAMKKGANADQISQLAYSYAKTTSKMISNPRIIDFLKRVLGEEEYKEREKIISRATNSLAYVTDKSEVEKIVNERGGGKALLSEESDNIIKAVLQEQQISQIIGLLDKIAREHPDENIRQAAQLESGYYQDRRDKGEIKDVPKSFLLALLREKEGGLAPEQERVAMPLGFFEGLKKYVNTENAVERMEEHGIPPAGQRLLQGIHHMSSQGVFGDYDKIKEDEDNPKLSESMQ
jgi:hypothetical protein